MRGQLTYGTSATICAEISFTNECGMTWALLDKSEIADTQVEGNASRLTSGVEDSGGRGGFIEGERTSSDSGGLV